MMNLVNDFFRCFPNRFDNPFLDTELEKEFQCLLDNLIEFIDSYAVSNDINISPVFDKCCAIELRVLCQFKKGLLCEVPENLRKAFACALMIKAFLTLVKGNCGEQSLLDSVECLDAGYLIGLPLDGWNVALALDLVLKHMDWSSRYTEDNRKFVDSSNYSEEQRRIGAFLYDSNYDTGVRSEDHFHTINSGIKFGRAYPTKVLSSMDEWPAIIKWKYVSYLKRVIGMRTVPIELGDYSRGGQQRLTTVSEYLENIIAGGTADQCGYLAQHPIFDQEWRLMTDIDIPAIVRIIRKCRPRHEDIDDASFTNIWLGPANTITPLHYDKYHSMLCQIFGRKFVTLYPPSDSQKLYPAEKPFSNTSLVNYQKPDYKLYPEFNMAVPRFCTLHPGEMLFIPEGWWHAVESLDVSCSVNFFF